MRETGEGEGGSAGESLFWTPDGALQHDLHHGVRPALKRDAHVTQAVAEVEQPVPGL